MKTTLKIEKKTLGKLSSNELEKALGGNVTRSRSDSQNTKFTEIYSCCHAGCPIDDEIDPTPKK